MTDNQWNTLVKTVRGEDTGILPTGFIIDSPWLPNWYGVNIIDYFTNDNIWLDANLKALNTFPDIIFLPGFWSEFGMCTEPSAFGSRCTFPANEFPHAHKVISSSSDIEDLPTPNPASDGLLPFMLNRLKINRGQIEDAGHKIRFALARGPLNIASYLMGTTEFLTMMMMEPDKTHLLLRKITGFLNSWLELQMETFRTIDGIFLLDDIIGFIGEQEFTEFGLPYFKELFSPDVTVKFLHNDASCDASVKFLPEMGVNLFNMAFDTDLNLLKESTQNKVTMMGNIPPRDVLASGSPKDVKSAVRKLMHNLNEQSRIIFSCGGGMPPDAPTENIQAFIDALKEA